MLTRPIRPPKPSERTPATRPAHENEIRISPARACGTLALLAAGLIAAGIISDVLHHVLGHPWAYGFVPYFDLDLSHAVPSFVAALFIAVLAIVLLAAGWAAVAASEPMARGWYVVAGIAAFMALDEGVGLHELLSRPTRASLGEGGLLVTAGVVVGLAALALVALMGRRFLATLPATTRNLLIAGTVIYWTGALGVDLLSGVYASQNGAANLGYGLIVALEEGLELAGLIVALYGALGFLRQRSTVFQLAIR